MINRLLDNRDQALEPIMGTGEKTAAANKVPGFVPLRWKSNFPIRTATRPGGHSFGSGSS